MSEPFAELSSISHALDELSQRIGQLADKHSQEGNGGIAFELFEVERSLTPGRRRLNKLING